MIRSRHDDLRGAILLIFLGGSFLVHQLRRWKRVQAIKESAVVPLQSAPQGFVELQGFAWPTQPFLAPLHKKTAAYCHLIVEKHEGKDNWKKIEEVEVGKPFYFVDPTGCAVVDSTHAEFDIPETYASYSGLSEEQKSRIHTMLSIYSSSTNLDKGGFFAATYRIREKVLLAGSPLYVMGHLNQSQQAMKPFPGVDRFVQNLTMFRKNPMSTVTSLGQGVVTSSSENATYIDLASQAANGFQAMPLASGSYGDPAPATDRLPFFGAIIKSMEHGLFIASCTQKEELDNLQSHMWLKIFGAALLASLGAALLAFQIHHHL